MAAIRDSSKNRSESRWHNPFFSTTHNIRTIRRKIATNASDPLQSLAHKEWFGVLSAARHRKKYTPHVFELEWNSSEFIYLLFTATIPNDELTKNAGKKKIIHKKYKIWYLAFGEQQKIYFRFELRQFIPIAFILYVHFDLLYPSSFTTLWKSKHLFHFFNTFWNTRENFVARIVSGQCLLHRK